MLKRFIKKRSSADVSSLARASLLGLHLVSGIIAGGALGYGFDYWLETSPKGLMIGVFIGIIAGFKNLYEDARRLINQESTQNDARDNTQNNTRNNTKEEQDK